MLGREDECTFDNDSRTCLNETCLNAKAVKEIDTVLNSIVEWHISHPCKEVNPLIDKAAFATEVVEHSNVNGQSTLPGDTMLASTIEPLRGVGEFQRKENSDSDYSSRGLEQIKVRKRWKRYYRELKESTINQGKG